MSLGQPSRSFWPDSLSGVPGAPHSLKLLELLHQVGLLSRRHPGKDCPVQQQLQERAEASQGAADPQGGEGSPEQAGWPSPFPSGLGWALCTHLRQEVPKALAEDLVGGPTQAEVEATVPGGQGVSPRLQNDPLQRGKGGGVGKSTVGPVVSFILATSESQLQLYVLRPSFSGEGQEEP